jgi:thiol-disulfide isomerase/thioredoxin
MKPWLSIILMTVLAGCSGNLPGGNGAINAKLPSLTLLLCDSITHFNTAAVPSNKPVVLVYFNPDCDFCRAETREIEKNMQSLEGVTFCFITAAPVQELRAFCKEFTFNAYPNVIAGVDYTNAFGKHFDIQSVPYMAIYNGKKEMKQVIIGTADAELIKNSAFH